MYVKSTPKTWATITPHTLGNGCFIVPCLVALGQTVWPSAEGQKCHEVSGPPLELGHMVDI